jgi:hypothetical protein
MQVEGFVKALKWGATRGKVRSFRQFCGKTAWKLWKTRLAACRPCLELEEDFPNRGWMIPTIPSRENHSSDLRKLVIIARYSGSASIFLVIFCTE